MDESHEESNGPAGADDDTDRLRISRRDALRKAAAGAAITGAVWAAPRVEGLSVVPDYATAGTGTSAARTLVISGKDAGAPSANDPGCDNANADALKINTPGSGPAAQFTFAANQVTDSPVSVTANANMPSGSPAPDLADVTVTFPPSDNAGDRTAPYAFNVAFNGIDPPFNNCRVEAGTATVCGTPAPTPVANVGDVLSVGAQPFNTSPAAESNPLSSFTVPVTILGPGPTAPDLGTVNLIVRCD